MKLKNKFFLIATSIIVFIIILGFFGDGILFFLSTVDDKLYGTENIYVDSTLTGDALSHPSNIKDGFKFNAEANSWFSTFISFMLIILKIFGIMLIPLFFWFLFVNKDTSFLEFIHDIFMKN